MNDEWEAIKNEIKQLRKQVGYSFATHATLVAIIAILLASPALSGIFFKDTTQCTISSKDCFATGRGIEMAVASWSGN